MRLIDADLIMDCLLNEGQNNGEKYGIKWGHKIIFTPYEVAKIVTRTVPTVDAVPVVRCKDCKNFVESDPSHPDCDYCKRMCWFGIIGKNDYCSKAERREETEC